MSGTPGGAGTGAGSQAAGAGAGNPADGTPAAATNADGKGSPTKKGPATSPAERAMARAESRKNSPDSGDKAGVKNAASDPAQGDGKGPDGSDKAAGAEGNKPDGVAAPADWSEAQRKAFDALPDDTARTMVLAIHKDFQSGYTQATQQVADIVKEHGGLLSAMQQHGADAGRVSELLTLAKSFDDNPRDVIEQLAKEKGVQVWFDQPLGPGEIPTFENDKDLVKWMDENTSKKVQDALKAEREKTDQATRDAKEKATRDEASKGLRAELDKAKAEIPDFDTHRPAVFEVLARAPGLSVEEAYGLATLPAVRQSAQEGANAMKELSALKAKGLRAAKDDTRPIQGKSGIENVQTNKHLSPSERAYDRAAAKRSARSG